MKRSPMPPRTTPMRRTPLKATTAVRKPQRYTGPTEAQILAVLLRDGHMCPCGYTVIGEVTDIQHRQRRSQGGTNCYCNLLTAHRRCHNRWDSRLHPADAKAGYTVRSRLDPARIPVLYVTEGGSQESWWLLADGTRTTDEPDWEAAA